MIKSSALIEEIYAEKYTIAPGCAVCQTPCGNTSDYDMNRIYNADADICSLKLKILSTLEEVAADLYSHQKMDVLTEESIELFYKALAYTGYDMEVPCCGGLEAAAKKALQDSVI